MLIPKQKPLSVPVPKATSFHVPEGKYRAKIVNVRTVPVQKLNCSGQIVRIMFEVQVPSLPRTVNLAKAEFRLDLHSGSELHNVLSRLLGKDKLVEAGGGRIDLDPLVGKDVEIEIEHVTTSRREEYSYPLVKVIDIQKPGTMALTEYKEANQ